jgi:hypothetical protein
MGIRNSSAVKLVRRAISSKGIATETPGLDDNRAHLRKDFNEDGEEQFFITYRGADIGCIWEDGDGTWTSQEPNKPYREDILEHRSKKEAVDYAIRKHYYAEVGFSMTDVELREIDRSIGGHSTRVPHSDESYVIYHGQDVGVV